MFKNFAGATADEAWLQIVESLRTGAGVRNQSGRGGNTQEILHAAISLENPRSRWVISRTPALNPAYAFAELIWTMNGREDSAFLTYFNSKLTAMAGDGPTFHGSYGKRLRSNLGFDQLARGFKALDKNPDSRQIVLQIWDGKIDLPNDQGEPVAQDIPCNLVSLLKIRDQRLEWTQVMRSNDIFRGIPYDFAQFTFLQEIVAGWLGIRPGTYCHVSDSLHAYLPDVPNLLAAKPRDAGVDTSDLALPFEKSAAVFVDLARAVDAIVDPNTPSTSLLETLHGVPFPASYRDMLAVLTAEGLRIRGETDAYQTAIKKCDNPLYRQMWGSWLSLLSGEGLEPRRVRPCGVWSVRSA